MGQDMGWDGGLTAAMAVRDLKAGIAWYRDVLGFELLYEVPDMAWAELKSPVARVNVGLSEVEKPEVKGGATLTFGVNDIARTRRLLEKKDVRFDGETMTIPDMVKLATFYDPDGNKLMLFQDLSRKHG